VRLSDRDLWFYFLEALGCDEAQARSVLAAIDRYEKAGDEAFKVYTDAHGALDPERKAKIISFLGIRSLAALEQILAPHASPKLAARLADWRQLVGLLDALGLGAFVEVDLGVVRGLAYYTGFVFEAFDRKGDLRALAGGGRYNDLVKKLGYADLPAVGFAIGDVTTGLLLEQRGLAPKPGSAPDVFVVIDGAVGRPKALPVVRELRNAGVRVEYLFKDQAFGKQFKAAAESGARFALIFGSDEIARGVAKIRNMVDRSEREVPLAEAGPAVRDGLRG
jgi:histidyl-tRNA synthetase